MCHFRWYRSTLKSSAIIGNSNRKLSLGLHFRRDGWFVGQRKVNIWFWFWGLWRYWALSFMLFYLLIVSVTVDGQCPSLAIQASPNPTPTEIIVITVGKRSGYFQVSLGNGEGKEEVFKGVCCVDYLQSFWIVERMREKADEPRGTRGLLPRSPLIVCLFAPVSLRCWSLLLSIIQEESANSLSVATGILRVCSVSVFSDVFNLQFACCWATVNHFALYNEQCKRLVLIGVAELAIKV